MVKLDIAHKKFIEHLKSKNRASATILAYGKDIEQLVEFLQELKRAHVHDVTAEDINAFLAKLSQKGYTPKSVSRKLNSTKTFFRFLKVSEYITDNPALLVPHPKYATKPPRTLSPLEYRALRDACREDARTAAIVEILLQTGIRIAELANLRLGDVKFSEGNFEGQLYIRPQEGRSSRVVPLNKPAETALKRYLTERPKIKLTKRQKESEQHIFITKNGKPLLIRNIRAAIDRYFKKAGIKDAKVNDLRHTWITHHLASGASIVLISKLAGHKRISTTEKYLGLINNQKRDDKAKLEPL
ncbi:MAG: tyrosine-type recombinase/integrase [Nitrososphaerota archaeon]